MNAYRNLTVALGFVLASVGNVTAGADMGPVIVVPGRPGVPVMVNGRDVSGAVIEGDWGLGHSPAGITIMQPRSWADPRFRGRRFPPQTFHVPRWGAFFPGSGRKPRLGRDEVIPPTDRPLPPKAEGFQRYWWSESPDLPPSIGPPWYLIPPMGVGVDSYSRQHGPRQAPDR